MKIHSAHDIRAIGLLVTTLFACAPLDDVRPEEREFAIIVADRQGFTPSSFSIVIDAGGDGIISCCCREGRCGDNRVGIRGNGVVFHDAPDSFGIVVKARGFRTGQAAVKRSNAADFVRIVMEPLDPFQSCEDYRTGFTVDNGFLEFRSISVKSNGEMGATYTSKFYIEGLDSTPVVYFQNTMRNPLHFLFVRDILKRPLTMEEFEQQTYHGGQRTAMAGSVICYADVTIKDRASGGTVVSPFALEFFPTDDLTPAQALTAYKLIEERMPFLLPCGGENRLFYLPPTAKHESALAGFKNNLASMGVLWLNREALYGGIRMQLLNPGEAYGALRLMSPNDLVSSPVSYKDVLLLTSLPNDMPLVGGTISVDLQTPLAHVNVAARSRGTPNLALPSALSDKRIGSLMDSLVRFKVTADTFLLERATIDEAQAFWSKRIPDTLTILTSDLTCDSIVAFSSLSFSDNIRVGVKAANLAELSRLLGKYAVDGFAVPFSSYADFVDHGVLTTELGSDAKTDCIGEGRDPALCAAVADYRTPFCRRNATLREFIDSLLVHQRFITDSRFSEASLDGLVYLFRHIPVSTRFAAALDAYTGQAFGNRRVKLRSSTNSEDLENFSGAGLYCSVAAQMGTPEPPSSEIRKVWGSVWGWKAFEERSFWNIDHKSVCMGVAVNPSFTDEEANGVLVTRNIAAPGVDGFYVNVQPGEASVTNPDSGCIPEIFSIVKGAVVRKRYSSLSPGSPVMSDEEIRQLEAIATKVKDHFTTLYGKDPWDETFALEMEFKLDDPERQVYIKQVRPFAK